MALNFQGTRLCWQDEEEEEDQDKEMIQRNAEASAADYLLPH